MLVVFFFNDTATTEIYTLSLHDALPISRDPWSAATQPHRRTPVQPLESRRSEEHTSELQSHVNLVCRLLLEKRKTHTASSPAFGCTDFISTATLLRLRIRFRQACQR